MTTKIIENSDRTSALFIQGISSTGEVKLIAQGQPQADLQNKAELIFSPAEIREIVKHLAAAAMHAAGEASNNAEGRK